MSSQNSVVLNKYESNTYDDSDGIAVIYHRDTNTLERVVYWSTRASVPADVLCAYSDNPAKEDYDAAKRILDGEYIKSGDINSGDTVEVFKGRKVPKGTQFEVSHMFDYTDRWGNVLTRYVVSEDGTKTNITNVKVVKPGNNNGRYIDLTRG